MDYQERTTILVIDEMNGISFEKYVKYLFEKNGYRVVSNNYKIDMGHDFIVEKKNIHFMWK